MLKGLFHVHSRYSFDSIMPEEYILRYALLNQINFLAVTDHDTIKGAVRIAQLNHNKNLRVIIGAEYFTDRGDIIGLFLKREVASRKASQVIEDVKCQGGITILPHPMTGHRLDTDLLHSIDIIEVFNARCNDIENQSALELAHKYKKAELGGADAHLPWEIGSSIVEFYPANNDSNPKEIMLHSERRIIGRYSPRGGINISQFIKGIKKKDRNLIISNGKRMADYCVKKILGEKAYGVIRR